MVPNMELENEGGRPSPSTSATDLLDLEGDGDENKEDKEEDEEGRGGRKRIKEQKLLSMNLFSTFPFC